MADVRTGQKSVQFVIESEAHEALMAFADQHHMSAGEVIRAALAAYLAAQGMTVDFTLKGQRGGARVRGAAIKDE